MMTFRQYDYKITDSGDPCGRCPEAGIPWSTRQSMDVVDTASI